MPGNSYNSNSSNIPPDRVTRLVRDKIERDLRKSSRASHPNDVTDNGGREVFEDEQRLRDGDNLGPSIVDEDLEGPASTPNEGCERLDGRTFSRQRLLVVANRLPVSAIRRGEDSWSLEISAGGLVSALLGKWFSE